MFITIKQQIKLYWVTTADHAENWFIFAGSDLQARSYHEHYEGYGMASGFMFGAMSRLGISTDTGMSPQTLVCLMLLAFVAFSRRAENGVFSVLLRAGIGSTMARIACPLALLFPFLLEAAKAIVIRHTQISAQYTTAMATAISAMLAFVLVLLVAWKIDRLEDAIQELALRDELTKVYNRRGFYMFAERALQIAHRSDVPFSVLFIDLDLLQRVFRKTDVIGGSAEMNSLWRVNPAELRFT